MKKIIVILSLLFVGGFTLNAQEKKYSEQDMLKQLETSSDSAKIEIYDILSTHFSSINAEKSIFYSDKGLAISVKNKKPRMSALLYEHKADAYWFSGNFSKAMEFYLKELRIGDSLNDDELIAKSKYNVGWIKTIQQKQVNQVFYLYDALNIFEALQDTHHIILVYDALGNFYSTNYKSFKFYRDSCRKYFIDELKFVQASRYKINEASGFANAANFFLSDSDYVKCKEYSKKAIKVSQDTHDEYNYVASSISLAGALYNQDSLFKSEKLILALFPYFSNPIHKPARLSAYNYLERIYSNKKEYEKAYRFASLMRNLQDSINQETFDQSLLQKETDYQLDKKNKELEVLEQKNQVQLIKNKQNKYVIGGLGLIAILIIGFAYNLFRSNKTKQHANIMLSEQHKIIADKKEEIEQSIHYAKGIQNAILPSVNELKKLLPNSFILYLPKDVVSGDFYWFNDMNTWLAEKKQQPREAISDGLLLAAADCTGHGVPGSLMSIVSVDKLNQSVLSKKLTRPSGILKSINNDIKNALKQDGETNIQKDGLDIALLLVERGTNKLTYSGANRPLWIIRKGEVFEYKATKSSIAGHTELNKEFDEQVIQLEKDDLVIISSDGYADQFGGNNGKKLMTKSFKQYLLALAPLAVTEIEKGLMDQFNAWKGSHEQVDDVLVIGFKI